MNILYQAFGFVLYQIYNLVKDYGFAVILFTIIVKTIILPLNIKQTNSMREMQAVQPELNNLQKKYKNNPEKLNAETMKLYKLYNVNPMAGCLPLLIQLPIIWGLFGALRSPAKYVFTNGNLSALRAGFYWIPNLGKPDPYFVLPILCVVLTFITQWYMMRFQDDGNKAAQSSQKVMLYVMPLMIGWFAVKMPAGVALYWVVQNAYTFVQQFLVMRKPVEKVSIEEAERRVEEAKRQEKKEKKSMLKEQSQMRQQQMTSQSGKTAKKKASRPKTKPASSRRKVVTKIPQSDERTKKS
ncbi:YidC/Oxa1 family membrane protein insertase [Pseudoramibacter alactolyticus]|uniref:YidC/Oxa1 family membrane protein insertase n=1 Tax=Pseudoramibacter alactolyticus TaxID=113287 RepID=UPI002352878B|nr:YidC/Oxa1 family membrane protein insertase [Pseudoramibacter alactolyticus]MBM6968484.1 YidC/Oxa1 family membrane protein insertase [Pseudoramibacter alactolyticus]